MQIHREIYYNDFHQIYEIQNTEYMFCFYIFQIQELNKIVKWIGHQPRKTGTVPP